MSQKKEQNAASIETKKENVETENAIPVSIPPDKKIKLPDFLMFESMIGAVLMLVLRSEKYRYLFAGDFEWLIVPPIRFKQFRLFRSKNNEPLAFVSWAHVSESVESRLAAGHTRLSPKEWQSGESLWLMDVIAPFGGAKEILKQLSETEFKNKPIKFTQPKKDGAGFECRLLQDLLKEG